MKIGMYSDEEILEHLTEGEGKGFLGRSMYDAIIEKINKKEAMYDSLAVDYRLAQEKIERLNNIISKIEKLCIDNLIYDELGMKVLDQPFILDKIKELKGSDKE